MIRPLREFAHLVRERQRLAEIRKLKFLFQMMFIHHMPAVSHSLCQFAQFFALQWRRAALAWNAFLFSQFFREYLCRFNLTRNPARRVKSRYFTFASMNAACRNTLFRTASLIPGANAASAAAQAQTDSFTS